MKAFLWLGLLSMIELSRSITVEEKVDGLVKLINEFKYEFLDDGKHSIGEIGHHARRLPAPVSEYAEDNDHGLGIGGDHSNLDSDADLRRTSTHLKAVHVPYAVEVPKHIPYPVKIHVPVKVPYPVEKKVPYPVHIDRPYPVKVYVPAPYEVIKKVPYPIYVPQPYPVTIEKKVPYEVIREVEVYRPYPVVKHVPYEVKADRPFHVPYSHEQSLAKAHFDYGTFFEDNLGGFLSSIPSNSLGSHAFQQSSELSFADNRNFADQNSFSDFQRFHKFLNK